MKWVTTNVKSTQKLWELEGGGQVGGRGGVLKNHFIWSNFYVSDAFCKWFKVLPYWYPSEDRSCLIMPSWSNDCCPVKEQWCLTTWYFKPYIVTDKYTLPPTTCVWVTLSFMEKTLKCTQWFLESKYLDWGRDNPKLLTSKPFAWQ